MGSLIVKTFLERIEIGVCILDFDKLFFKTRIQLVSATIGVKFVGTLEKS
jgi:hypothetical protein